MEPVNTYERFAYVAPTQVVLEGRVRGRAVPYNVSDGRPGEELTWNPDGTVQARAYTASVFKPGVFTRWLGEEGQAARVAYLWAHGLDRPYYGGLVVTALPIGRIVGLESKDDGLYFEAQLARTPMAEQVRELLALGALRDISVTTVPRRTTIENGIRYIEDAELWDISHVLWGQFGDNARVHEVWAGRPMLRAAVNATDFVATPFADLPVDLEEPWNPADVGESELINAILGPAGDDWDAMKQAHLVWAPTASKQLDGYKLKIARRYPAGDPRGTLKVNFRQLASRVAILNGAREGVDLTEETRRAAYAHAVKYYEKVGRDPPALQETLKHIGAEFSAANIAKILDNVQAIRGGLSAIAEAADALEELVAPREPPGEKERGDVVEDRLFSLRTYVLSKEKNVHE